MSEATCSCIEGQCCDNNCGGWCDPFWGATSKEIAEEIDRIAKMKKLGICYKCNKPHTQANKESEDL